MARTLAQIEQQIAKLQQEAKALKAKELGGVVKRIKDAIAHYGITPQELFGKAPSPARKGKPKAAGARPAAKKAPLPVKYRDEAGHTWSGHGKRPEWFKQAVASGKTAEDLAVKP